MRADVTQRAGDAAVGAALAALGVWGTWTASRLGLGTAGEPGAGLFPAGVCVLLTLGGLGCVLRAWLAGRAATGDGTGNGSGHSAGQRTLAVIEAKALKVLILIALLCAAFVPLGMPLAGFAFVITMVRTLGAVAWGRAALIAAITVGAFWLVFEVLLSVQLPYGWWLSAQGSAQGSPPGSGLA